MLCERGAMPDVAKVLDFGLVKHVTADQGDTKQIIIGTPAYLAPEAATDPNHITSAADIYSLGAVAYFLLTGRRVFEGKTAIDICVQHATMTPAPLPNVAATLASVVMSCLAKAPDERPSAAVLAESLRSLAAVDWSESQAQAWWTDFSRRRQAVPRSTNTTETITVDLGRRADVDDRTALN